MRSFSLLQDTIVPYIPTLIGQLTHKLLLVSKVNETSLLCWVFVFFARTKWIFEHFSLFFFIFFRTPVNPTSTIICLSLSACPSVSTAKPTPPLWAASRRRSSPSSLRSFRTMCRVGGTIQCWKSLTFYFVSGEQENLISFLLCFFRQSSFRTCSRWCPSSWRSTPTPSPPPTWLCSLTCCSPFSGSVQETSPRWCGCFRPTCRREAPVSPTPPQIK